MSDNGTEPGPLPPPAFPPGSKRRVRPAVTDGGVPEDAFISPDAPIERGSIPDDAIFSPDDPIVRSGTRMPEDAFFSPDEPVVRDAPPVKPEDFEAVVSGAMEEEGESEVVVTGMNLDAHKSARGGHRFDDPHVEMLYAKLVGLVKGVKEKGEAGLRTSSEMSRFEATLRGYCVGYLAGLRENPEPDA